MPDQNAIITLREVYDKLTELATRIGEHMSRQDTQYALLEQRVGVLERDLDRHSTEAAKSHTDLRTEIQKETGEIRDGLEDRSSRGWLLYTSLIGSAAALIAAVLPLVIH